MQFYSKSVIIWKVSIYGSVQLQLDEEYLDFLIGNSNRRLSKEMCNIDLILAGN